MLNVKFRLQNLHSCVTKVVSQMVVLIYKSEPKVGRKLSETKHV